MTARAWALAVVAAAGLAADGTAALSAGGPAVGLISSEQKRELEEMARRAREKWRGRSPRDLEAATRRPEAELRRRIEGSGLLASWEGFSRAGGRQTRGPGALARGGWAEFWQRTLRLPKAGRSKAPRPLVLDFTGIGLESVADREGLLALQVRVPARKSGASRAQPLVARVPARELVLEASRKHPVDARRVYAVGSGAGAAAVLQAACSAPEALAAVALVEVRRRASESKVCGVPVVAVVKQPGESAAARAERVWELLARHARN